MYINKQVTFCTNSSYSDPPLFITQETSSAAGSNLIQLTGRLEQFITDPKTH